MHHGVTYTRTGDIQWPHTKRRNQAVAGFSLGDLKRVIRDLGEEIARVREDFAEGFSQGEQEMLLARLVVERLMGGRLPAVHPFARHDATLARVSQVQAFSLDLAIDVQSVTAWQGGVAVSDLHLEIHLEAVRVHTSFTWEGNAAASLRQLDSRTVDTGQYLIAFRDMTTLEIHDKYSRVSTTVWGDPHVDLSDVDGNCNGEFSDLTASDMRTTFSLLDGTEVVITAPDTGAIEMVDVFKGGSHIRGIGRMPLPEGPDGLAVEREPWHMGGRFLSIETAHGIRHAMVRDSDIVRSGGDGNDWYDSKGNLVWGSTS